MTASPIEPIALPPLCSRSGTWRASRRQADDDAEIPRRSPPATSHQIISLSGGHCWRERLSAQVPGKGQKSGLEVRLVGLGDRHDFVIEEIQIVLGTDHFRHRSVGYSAP